VVSYPRERRAQGLKGCRTGLDHLMA
jgi:hypothetical protein